MKGDEELGRRKRRASDQDLAKRSSSGAPDLR